jgi:hypothetical protein
LRRFLLVLVLCVLPAAGGQWQGPSAFIALYTEFTQTPPAAVERAIHKEVEGIMSPAGLRFDWHSLAESNGQVSTQLAVIHFKGRCDADDLRQEWQHSEALGWTHVSNGEILPFIFIDCESVRRFVQRQLRGMLPVRRDPLFGRAIARILAHELYHLLTQTTQHSTNGLAKASYSVGDLLAERFPFEKREREALRDRSLRLLALSGPITQTVK